MAYEDTYYGKSQNIKNILKWDNDETSNDSDFAGDGDLNALESEIMYALFAFDKENSNINNDVSDKSGSNYPTDFESKVNNLSIYDVDGFVKEHKLNQKQIDHVYSIFYDIKADKTPWGTK